VASAIAWLSKNDDSLPEFGITCKQVSQEVADQYGVDLARFFRTLLNIAEEL
jgi:hypothetical protein